MFWNALKFSPHVRKIRFASSRRSFTPSSTFWPASGVRSNEYQSHSSGFTGWKRASSQSA